MMPSDFPAEQSRILDLLSQPVFLVCSEQITYRNHAAAALDHSGTCRISDLLSEEDLACYRTYQGDGALALLLLLDGRPYSATVTREAQGDIFIAQSQPLYDTLSLDTLAVVADTVRKELTDLFDAASTLFPALEELENARIQHQTARLNRGLYRLLRISANLAEARAFLAGERRAFLERTELRGFLQDLCDRSASLFQAAGAQLLCTVPAQVVYAAVDRQKLERALLNLLSNALRHSPLGGQVTVRLESTLSSVYIRVSDRGRGMTPAQLATAFDRFEHHAPLSTDPQDGIGLGLPLVRAIAGLHGGTLVINTTPAGTTATMSLSRRLVPDTPDEVRSPVRNYDYAGALNHAILELADCLPDEVFDTRNLD